MQLSITLEEALVGFTRELTHLDGHKVILSRTDVTKPGQVLTVQDEGMPLPEYGSEKGDLFVTIKVVFPRAITPSQRDAVRALMSSWQWDA